MKSSEAIGLGQYSIQDHLKTYIAEEIYGEVCQKSNECNFLELELMNGHKIQNFKLEYFKRLMHVSISQSKNFLESWQK